MPPRCPKGERRNNTTKKCVANSRLNQGMQIVKTIDDGDCMFAAFAMAYKNQPWPVAQQPRLAQYVRESVVETMKKKSFWETKELPFLLEEDDRERLQNYVRANIITQKSVDLAYAYPAKGSTAAYISIMEKPGMWGGTIELQALTETFDCDIILSTKGQSTRHTITAPIHDGHAPVYMYYNGINHYEAIVREE